VAHVGFSTVIFAWRVPPHDMMHPALRCRELDWSAGVDWDPKGAAIRIVRRGYRDATIADPFPGPTVGLATAGGNRFHYRCKRE
jgi:hypothetical protein